MTKRSLFPHLPTKINFDMNFLIPFIFVLQCLSWWNIPQISCLEQIFVRHIVFSLKNFLLIFPMIRYIWLTLLARSFLVHLSTIRDILFFNPGIPWEGSLSYGHGGVRHKTRLHDGGNIRKTESERERAREKEKSAPWNFVKGGIEIIPW